MKKTGDINVNDLAEAIRRFKKLPSRPNITEVDAGRQGEVQKNIAIGFTAVLNVSFEYEVPERKRKR